MASKPKCSACGKFVPATGVANCSVCPSLYHKGCVSMPESSPVSTRWVCPQCVTRTRKGDNTPVRSTAPDALAQSAAGAATTTVLRANSPAAPSCDLQEVRQELSDWMVEIREFRREMAEFRSSVAGLSSRMDSIELRLETMELRREECPPEIAELKCKVALLQQELYDRDQDALLSDLEIGHLPEEKGENLVHTISLLATKVGVVLDEREIVFAERVGVVQRAGSGGEAPRERRVIVRLARRHVRDQLLQAARVRRTLTIAKEGRDGARPQARIYINERLTRTNRQLFHRAREECRKLQWRYSWTRRGRVFVRQADNMQAYPIKSQADLERVFGLGSV